MTRISQTFALALVRSAAVVFLVGWGTLLAQNNPTPPPFPPPGKLIDVGGWRLHLNCTGEPRSSEPTVILEAGKGDFSVEWSLVQPGVAKFAQVCSYDRAGDGWSDLGPHPRTFRQIVYELHTLLDKAGVKPPFVMVGHSYGGWLVRLYTLTYPKEVVGMVLVEAGVDNPWRLLANGKLVTASELATGQPIPAVQTSKPLRISDIPPPALSQMKAAFPKRLRQQTNLRASNFPSMLNGCAPGRLVSWVTLPPPSIRSRPKNWRSCAIKAPKRTI